MEGMLVPLYCSAHKLDCMIDIINRNKRCKASLCYTFATKKCNGYCLYCHINLFPDKPVSRNYKTKEQAVVDYVKEQFPDQSWATDKRVQNGCSKRRPDMLLDLGYQILIVEVDENQHVGYDCSCENKRLMELSIDVGHRPIIFIRFNPDDYQTNEGNITSCWGIDGNGICNVKKSKVREWQDRLTALTQTIAYWTHPDHQTNKTIETIQLFYDTNTEDTEETEEPPVKRIRPNDI